MIKVLLSRDYDKSGNAAIKCTLEAILGERNNFQSTLKEGFGGKQWA